MPIARRSTIATLATTAALALAPGLAAGSSPGAGGNGTGISATGSTDPSMSLGALLTTVGSMRVNAQPTGF
jgi:hypothetical protein